MTAAEIIRRTKDGETVEIPTSETVAFMDECEANNIRCQVYMSIGNRVCKISKGPAGNGKK